MSIESTVTAAVAAVAPINGISFGDLSDKSTWRIDFQPSATDQQKAAAQAVIDNFNLALETARNNKQQALDDLLDGNFDLKAFIRAGTSATITAANVGSFLATITNNYRSLRAQIAAAASVSAINAINFNSGWPNNP